MSDLLYHFSDQPGIERFDPRPAPHANNDPGGRVVWAVDQAHAYNYLLPRQCPRVTFSALPDSDPADVARLMGWSDARYVVAIEAHWLPEARRQCLFRYAFPATTFSLIDQSAGYYISRVSVVPSAVTPIPDLLAALLDHDVELRIMPSLWKLRDQVIASTLEFSIIRMRNAQPPRDGYAAHHPL